MAKPTVYIHRNGGWYDRYLPQSNRDLLASFAEVIDDSSLTEPPADLRDKVRAADAILSLNGNGVNDLTPDMFTDSRVRVAAVSHWFHGRHDDARDIWRAAGIEVIDASWGNNVAVAQWTLGAMITGVFQFAQLDRAMRSGEHWPEFHFSSRMLDGQRVGIVGLGRIGRLVAGLLEPFGVEIVGYDAYVGAEDAASFGVTLVPLEELMSTSDIISFHLPVTDSTTRMITRTHIKSIRERALVVNSARTAILDYDAFIDGLKANRFHAIVDVYEPEPPPLDDPLRSLPNVVTTPHIAGATAHMCGVCGRTAIQALKDWFATH